MEFLKRRQSELMMEGVSLEELGRNMGTPLYVYSLSAILEQMQAMQSAFGAHPTTFCYAVKANSNINLLKEIFKQGFGADIVSVGELERALVAGADPGKIVFSGVGKDEGEIRRGLEAGILCFNVESMFELRAISRIAKAVGKKARICLRINPNIDAKSNPKISTGLYTSKFGIPYQSAAEYLALVRDRSEIQLIGLACHIGSQIVDLSPVKNAAQSMVKLCKETIQAGFPIVYLDLGGGLGIQYDQESPPAFQAYADTILSEIKETSLKLILEPGRVIVGNSGVLITKVLGIKRTPAKRFVVIDAGMNDLLRPSMYDAYHAIEPAVTKSGKLELADIVGPICETTDILASDRPLPDVNEGDLLVVKSCGAYGFSMASHYNTRPKPAEILVQGASAKVIRRRERLADLWASEYIEDSQ
jgi:diaminopimelate decarboxylase